MSNSIIKYHNQLKILEKHLGKKYYSCGELHDAITEAMSEYAELHAKEFAEYFNDFCLPLSEMISENKNDKRLLSREPDHAYYNCESIKWAKDINELYQQFKKESPGITEEDKQFVEDRIEDGKPFIQDEKGFN